MQDRIRTRFHFSGIVQGVGFRPFIYRIAVKYNLAGFVRNRTDGVIAEVEGQASMIESFIADVRNELPPLAEITSLTNEDIPVTEICGFAIIESDASGMANVHITPDIATCEECLSELFNPADRRYHYPFINCTNCGPRLTIIKNVPYDRKNTSMACFELCPDCRKEYEDPGNRRFHAEPNACPVCGPQLKLLGGDGDEIIGDSIAETARLIKEGFIMAVKGIGGYHLCADAMNDEALRRLRNRKFREEKPLAIMVKDIASASNLAAISEGEAGLLSSPQRPIVLLDKKESGISELVAPGMSRLGVMLPYTPIHHLLFDHGFEALVMTSANQTDEPICTGNREALERLGGIADYFLVHSRDILVHCDDSIVFDTGGGARMMRRARGYAPRPVILDKKYPNVLAMGPQLKSTVCVLKGSAAYLSPHIGDLETPQARDFYHQSIELMQDMTECRPEIIACDMHPAYYSTRAAESLGGKIQKVQHHHAHIVSCMAEYGLDGSVIGIALDGTGYGTDGTVWGGEIMVACRKDFIRVAHISPFMLPGGEKAIKEPWRTGVGLLRLAYGDEWPEIAGRLKLIPEDVSCDVMDKVMSSGFNSPLTSSMGRLFDGVAAIAGIRRKINFEGQAAMELEAAAVFGSGIAYKNINVTADNNLSKSRTRDCFVAAAPRNDSLKNNGHCEHSEAISYSSSGIYENRGNLQIDTESLIREICSDIFNGVKPSDIAFKFHVTVSRALAEAAVILSRRSGLDRVVLSGGCFQNRLLLENLTNSLEKSGLEVFSHRLIPTNDGGISLGQAVCAAENML
jgi:hydrogenase maturation protein HypF